MVSRHNLGVYIFFPPIIALAQTPCVDGKAGVYDCNQVDLMALVNFSDLRADEVGGVYLNDLWGWTDPITNKEYVLVGMTNGTSFVDISDPEQPSVLGILPEHEAANTEGRIAHDGDEHDTTGGEAKSLWRDIKTYQNYAFIVSEDPASGMQVFDLSQLREVQDTFLTFNESAHYDLIGNAHNIVINEQTGYAYAVGATNSEVCSGGGLHIIDIKDPLMPSYAGCFDENDYTHDAQCVVYTGEDDEYFQREICFNSNENTVAIVDVTNKENIQLISNTTYSEVAYTHQGWLSEDQKYFYSNDELDELAGTVDKTATYVWDLSDLDEPILTRRYDHPRFTIDHNLYVANGRIYQSNYTTGLVILDEHLVRSNHAQPELAYFDSYILNDERQFRGSWSNYPYFESGVIAITDMTTGLFIVKPNIELTVLSQPADLEICHGDVGQVEIDVRQVDVAYQWQVFSREEYQDIQNDVRFDNATGSSLTINGSEVSDGELTLRCKMTATSGNEYFSNEINVSVIEPPRAHFNFHIDNNQVTFINESERADHFIWDFGFGNEKDSLNPVTIFKYPYESNSYEVSLIVSNSCGTDTLTQEIVLEVLGVSKQQFKVYPNPATDGFFQIMNSELQNFQIFIITDLQGRMVLTSNSSLLDVSSIQTGIYLVAAKANEFECTTRVVIINE